VVSPSRSAVISPEISLWVNEASIMQSGLVHKAYIHFCLSISEFPVERSEAEALILKDQVGFRSKTELEQMGCCYVG